MSGRIKFTHASLAVVLLCCVLQLRFVCADDNSLPPLSFDLTGFTPSDEAILREAMKIVAARFRSYAVVGNALGVADRYRLADRTVATQESKDNLTYVLPAQIGALKMADTFPDIHLHAFDVANNTWGFVEGKDVGTVVVHGDLSVSGSFIVHLNRRHMSSYQGKSATLWASVIAHEMLHCLGHLHGKDEYTTDLQINAFDNALYHNGRYKRGMPRAFFYCGKPRDADLAHNEGPVDPKKRSRIKWSYENGYFAEAGHLRWEEWQEGRKIATFRKIGETDEFVYLYDEGRNLTTRLGEAKECWRVGEDGDFNEHYSGGWEP